MKKLKEILEMVSKNEKPTPEELFYAVHALDKLINADQMDLQGIRQHACDKEDLNDIRININQVCQESIQSLMAILEQDPKAWLTMMKMDPADPEYQERVKRSIEQIKSLQASDPNYDKKDAENIKL